MGCKEEMSFYDVVDACCGSMWFLFFFLEIWPGEWKPTGCRPTYGCICSAMCIHTCEGTEIQTLREAATSSLLSNQDWRKNHLWALMFNVMSTIQIYIHSVAMKPEGTEQTLWTIFMCCSLNAFLNFWMLFLCQYLLLDEHWDKNKKHHKQTSL